MRKTVFILAAIFMIMWNVMPSEGASEREEFYALFEHAMNAESSGQDLEAKEYYERALPLCLKLFGEVLPRPSITWGLSMKDLEITPKRKRLTSGRWRFN